MSDPDGAATDDRVAALERADEDLRRARERVAEFGRAELDRLGTAYDEFTDLLASHEEPATGDGDFQEFIEFQGTVETFVERLPDDLLLRETFVECDDYLQQRRLTGDDFAHVRAQLDPVDDLVARLDDEREAGRDYRQAYSALQRRRRELAEHVEDLERLQSLGDADLDAPTERLRDPIESYNEAVSAAFDEFRREAPAREVLDLLAKTREFPLVSFRQPRAALREFVADREVGTEPIPRLLEYADYSRSKLAHYVDDPAALERDVASQQTYLERLDAAPLAVEWPPPPAETLRFHTREYRAVVSRFAPDVVPAIRTVRRLPLETDYERLRGSAVAAAELSADERERLRTGSVAADLEAARGELARVRDALAEYPDR
jgi:hypothetical protein